MTLHVVLQLNEYLFSTIFKFAAAKSQDSSYCRWGQILPEDAVTQSMFIASGCPNSVDPNYVSNVDQQSFCTTCMAFSNSTIEPTVSPSQIDPIVPIYGSFLPILSQAELFHAVDAYFVNGSSSDVVQQYGYPIGAWDVSQLTDFSNAFACERNSKSCDFNEYIGAWNTTSAVLMSHMFAGAALFNQDISSWSTEKVINMTGMCKCIICMVSNRPFNLVLLMNIMFLIFRSHGC